MAEQWLSIVEYARTFAISDMTVRRRIKNGKLHAVLKDGKYYIPVGVAGQGTSPVPAMQNQVQIQRPTPRPTIPQVGVIKDHPSAQATFAPQASQQIVEQPILQTPQQLRPTDNGAESPIPSTIRGPLAARETSIVDTRALIAFCEATIKRSAEAERRQSEKFRYKMSTLEEQLRNKEQEINQLRQQIEDMKVLVNILEKRL